MIRYGADGKLDRAHFLRCDDELIDQCCELADALDAHRAMLKEVIAAMGWQGLHTDGNYRFENAVAAARVLLEGEK